MNVESSFILGGVIVPWRASYGYTQDIEALDGRSQPRRFYNGSAIVQTVWSGKHRITLSGDSWAPVGLDGLDFDNQLVLSCALPVGRRANVASIALPTTRRSGADVAPFGRAYLPGNNEVETPVSVVGDVATCTAVTGAIGYAVMYWPEFTVYVTDRTENSTSDRYGYGWQIVCEEA